MTRIKLPQVSVIVPAYNSEYTIEICINSILAQSIEDIQIIVIDDGSTDNTYEIIKKVRDIDERVELIKQENAGPSAARNKGLEFAKGEFVSFVDADDTIMPEMFSSLLRYQKEYNADLVISGIRRIINRNEKFVDFNVDKKIFYSKKREINNNFVNMLSMGINSPVGRIYKMNIIREYNLKLNEELDVGEDLQFNIEYIEKINSILFVPDIYYQYNTFNSFLSFKYRKNIFDKRKKAIQLLGSFLERNGIKTDIINYLYIKLIYASAMQEIENRNHLKSRLYKIKRNLQNAEVKNAIIEYRPTKMTDRIMYKIVGIQSPFLIDLLAMLFVVLRKREIFFKNRISV